jgi:A/G-specific adenine glycosylase
LYQFPLIEGQRIDLNKELTALTGLNQRFKIEKSNSFKHVLTHQRLYADFYQVELAGLDDLKEECIAVSFEDLDNYAKPKLIVNYIESINKN